MRLDELPTSDRIEDRRRVPGGRAGLGIGTVVILGLLAWALGIDPRVLIGGAEMMSRNGQTQQRLMPDLPARRPMRWATSYPPFLVARRWNGRTLRSSRKNLQTADAGHVFWLDPVGLRVCASRHGSFNERRMFMIEAWDTGAYRDVQEIWERAEILAARTNLRVS